MKENRWNIKNHDLEVGELVLVDFVRTQGILDFPKGLGWVAYKVIVAVTRINDLTFCFDFNGERHFEMKSDVKRITTAQMNLFDEAQKIKWAKDSLDYRLKIEYGI